MARRRSSATQDVKGRLLNCDRIVPANSKRNYGGLLLPVPFRVSYVARIYADRPATVHFGAFNPGCFLTSPPPTEDATYSHYDARHSSAFNGEPAKKGAARRHRVLGNYEGQRHSAQRADDRLAPPCLGSSPR
jgi:hypothetical protein